MASLGLEVMMGNEPVLQFTLKNLADERHLQIPKSFCI
jgi:hypothetical protein